MNEKKGKKERKRKVIKETMGKQLICSQEEV